MLKEAEQAFLYLPPQNVIDDFPQFPIAKNYDDMKKLLIEMGI